MGVRFYPAITDVTLLALMFDMTLEGATKALSDAQAYDKAMDAARAAGLNDYPLYSQMHTENPKGFDVAQFLLYGFGKCEAAYNALRFRGHGSDVGTCMGDDAIQIMWHINHRRFLQGRAPVPEAVINMVAREGLSWS